tara:strand:+ start:118 stop:1167 length:1050 start_codon:yes stop_codon:yes gene_type:complete
MPSLMEEAIVDARALKEAALKNAENVVLEKYSTEVKSALSTLLEQEMEPMPEPMLEPAEDEVDMGFVDEVPYAFQDEEIDGPAEEEIVEIDFDALKARLGDEEVEGGDLNDALEMADEFAPDELDFSEPELEDELPADLDLGSDEEEIDLSEDMLSGLIEELVLDMTPRPNGWSSVGGAENSVEQANNDAMASAKDAHSEEDEEDEEVASDVVDDSALFESKNSQLTNINKELHALVKESKNQLTKLILENAKLVYQNKALNSASLNERQRVKIVEAVQSANSVEEAKVIYETFQNSVSSPRRKSRRPETLREAVQRPTSLLMSSRESNKAKSDPKMGRMLRLAGLTKK